MEAPARQGGRHAGRAGFILLLLLVGALLYRSFAVLPAFRLFAGILVSLVLEAAPYLVLGAVVAAVVHELLPVQRIVPHLTRLGVAGVPLAALTGIVAPVCECAIVPTVDRLMRKGVPRPFAMTMLVAIPLLNPVVFLSTAVAFPGGPRIVAARFIGGFAVSLVVGLAFFLYETLGSNHPARAAGGVGTAPDAPGMSVGTAPDAPGMGGGTAPGAPGMSVGTAPDAPLVTGNSAHAVGWTARLDSIVTHAVEEFLSITRYFLAGAALSSLVQATVPAERIATIAANPALAVLVMIALAFLLSVCSEADAFVGKAFLPLVGAPAVVAFLVFGPMLDLKNTAMLMRAIRPREVALLAVVLTAAVSLLAYVLEGLL